MCDLSIYVGFCSFFNKAVFVKLINFVFYSVTISYGWKMIIFKVSNANSILNPIYLKAEVQQKLRNNSIIL